MNAETESRSTELDLDVAENLNRSIAVSLQTADVSQVFMKSAVPSYVTVSGFDKKNKMLKVDLVKKIGAFSDYPSLAENIINVIHFYLASSYGRVIVVGDQVKTLTTYTSIPHQAADQSVRGTMMPMVEGTDNDNKVTFLITEEDQSKYIASNKALIRMSRNGVRTVEREFNFPIFSIDKELLDRGEEWAKKNEFPWPLLDSYINYFVTRNRYAMPRSGDMDGLNVALYKHRSVEPYLTILDNSPTFRRLMFSVMNGYVQSFVSIISSSASELRSALKGQAEFNYQIAADAQNSIDAMSNADGVQLMKEMIAVTMFNSRTRLHFNVGDLNSSKNEIAQIAECLVALLMPGHVMSDESYSVICNYIMVRLIGQSKIPNFNAPAAVAATGITDLNRDALSPLPTLLAQAIATTTSQRWKDFLEPLERLCYSFGSGGSLGSRSLNVPTPPVSRQPTSVETSTPRNRVSASTFLRVGLTELGAGRNNVPSIAWQDWRLMGNALMGLLSNRGSANFSFANTTTGPKVLSAVIRTMLERDNEMRMWSEMEQELIPLYMSPLTQQATDAFEFGGGYDLIPIANRSILAMFLKIKFSRLTVGNVTTDIVHQGITMLDACEKVMEAIGVADDIVSQLSDGGLLPFITRPDYQAWLSSGDIVRMGLSNVRSGGSQAVEMIKTAMTDTGISATWHAEARKYYASYLVPPPLLPIMNWINYYPGLFGIAQRCIMWPIVSRVQRVDADLGESAITGGIDPPIPIDWSGYYTLDDNIDEAIADGENIATTLAEAVALLQNPFSTFVVLKHTALQQLALIPGKLSVLDDAVKRGVLIILDVPCYTYSGPAHTDFSSVQELFVNIGRNRVGPSVSAAVQPTGRNVLYDEGYLDAGVKIGVESRYCDFRYWPHQVSLLNPDQLPDENPLRYYTPTDPFIFRSDFRFIGDQEYRMIN
jgi:hypothetical protein